jgi:two-component system response regulator FixJ
MITGNASVRLVVDVMKAGATDFLQKPFDSEALLAAVLYAVDGRARVGHEARSLDRFRRALTRTTSRERDVLRGLMSGKTNKLIARDLNISPRTVELHRARLMEKTAARTLSDLVRMSLLSEGAAPPAPSALRVAGRSG